MVLFNVTTLFAQHNQKDLREITGTVTYQEMPLAGVNIMLKNSIKGTKTNAQGFYRIEAKPGDVLTYSHLGYKTLSLLVEDVTNVLNIEMVLITEELEEVTVKAEKEDYLKERKDSYGKSKKIYDAISTYYVKGEDLSQSFDNVVDALANEGIPGVSGNGGILKSNRNLSINNSKSFLWDIDGMLFNTPPYIHVSMVKDVRVIKSLSDISRYGSEGAGGVIVIRTNNAANMDEVKTEEIAKKYYSNVFYNNNAVSYKTKQPYYQVLLSQVKALGDKQKAVLFLQEQIDNKQVSFHQAIEAAVFLKIHYQDIPGMVAVLQTLTKQYQDNPELLKTIAYYYQELGKNQEAVLVFEKVFKLRPAYLQSYIDLANAYKDTRQYKKAWRMYMSYLNQGKDISNLEISKLINSEMEWLYYLQKANAGIKTKFIPQSNSIKDFQNDVRLVIEWNTSDADFEMEFVNPENRAYHFKHTLQENQDVVMSEKQVGFSSREFIIDDLGEGQWLVNITYFGNKKPEPTYFKFTLYSNWGKPNEKKEVLVQNFYKERSKFQLLQLSKKSLKFATSQ